MNVPEAVKAIQDLQKQMNVAADTATVASRTYEATMTLYNVAVMTGDKAMIEQRRDELHTLLDTILDSGYEVGTGQREINRISREVHD